MGRVSPLPNKTPTGFKDALTALVVMKHPELENQPGVSILPDLVFDYMLVRPELEGVRDMAWLQAKVQKQCDLDGALNGRSCT